MKILKLKFKNIHSLKGENTIDFTIEPLANVGIFAIIGPTGSGKSTLLDVITLALFNKTPRIGTLSKNTVKSYGSVITRNTDDCFAEVEYEIKGKQYRSKWEISTARTGELRDYTMELAELPSEKLLSDKKGDVPNLNTEIIGLNYDQFVKSIVLSQGEFARFLKATPDERGDLLEKITGTEIYRKIGKAAFDKQKEEKSKLDLLKVRKEGINIFTNDELEILVNQGKDNKIFVIKSNEYLQKLSKLFSVKKNLKVIEKKKFELQNQLTFVDSEIKDFDPQISKLRKHEKLINLKSDIFVLKNNYSTKSDVNQKIIYSEKNLVEITKKHSETADLLDGLTNKKIDLEKQSEEIIPKVKKTRELDFSIQNQYEKIKEQDSLFQKKKIGYTENSTKIKELENKIISDVKQLEISEKLFAENKILEELEREFVMIEEKLQSFGKESNETIQQIKKNTNPDIQNQINKSVNWDGKLQNINNFISKLKTDKIVLSENLKYSPEQKSELETKLEDLKTEHDELKNQLQISEIYLKNTQKLNEITNQNLEIEKRINEVEKIICDDKNKTEILEKYIEELKIRKERQQLEAKYDQDRTKLILGEECFLCGSTEHPYVKSYQNKLDETSKLLKNNENELKNVISEIQLSSKKLTENQSILKSNIQNITDLKSEISISISNFENINQQLKNKSVIGKNDLIKLSVNQIIEEGKIIKQQIELISKTTEIQNIISDSENISEKISNINLKEKSLEELILKYKVYSKHEKDYLSILTIFEKELKTYNSVKEQINELKNNIFLNRNLVSEKTGILETIKNELIIQKQELDNLKHDLDNIKMQRLENLGDQKPDEVESSFRKLIKTNSENISEKEKTLTKLLTDKQNIERNITEMKSDFEILVHNILFLENDLLPKLKTEGFDNIETALKSLLNEEEIEHIRKKQTTLHDKKTSVIQSLKDNSFEFEKLKPEDDETKTFDETEKNIAELKLNIEEKNREIGIINNKIDEDNKRKSESKLLHEQFIAQEKEFLRWDELNELIGDAQGKKFTLYAQQITLNHLINLANSHLKKLNDRYILKKSDQSLKDNLIVIDSYMANSERSVQTLSGGESFLLSLALALGLSDLASKNTKIECLFIDEGFGTLDQQTLDIALATLEDLQNQTNRTIGIISHVQAIKERITTQIELKKVNSGYSIIEKR